MSKGSIQEKSTAELLKYRKVHMAIIVTLLVIMALYAVVLIYHLSTDKWEFSTVHLIALMMKIIAIFLSTIQIAAIKKTLAERDSV